MTHGVDGRIRVDWYIRAVRNSTKLRPMGDPGSDGRIRVDRAMGDPGVDGRIRVDWCIRAVRNSTKLPK